MPSVDYGDLPPLPPCDDGDEEAWMQVRDLIILLKPTGDLISQNAQHFTEERAAPVAREAEEHRRQEGDRVQGAAAAHRQGRLDRQEHRGGNRGQEKG